MKAIARIYSRAEAPRLMEGELKRFYFHCSDGLDLVLDREGIEADGSEVLWWGFESCRPADECATHLRRVFGLDCLRSR